MNAGRKWEFGTEVFQREDGKDAGSDGKEIYKYPHMWVENHSDSLSHLRNKNIIFIQKNYTESQNGRSWKRHLGII